MTSKEKVPDSEWMLIGDGTDEDPYRPDVFDEQEDVSDYHFDVQNNELYKIEEDNQ